MRFWQCCAVGLVFSLGLASCSGEDFTSGSGGSGPSGGSTGTGGGSGGSGGALPPSNCPALIPGAGTGCEPEALFCTYGSDARPSCRTHAECRGGDWDIVSEPNPTVCGLTTPCELATISGDVCLIKGEECVASDRFCACVCNPNCVGYKWNCPKPATGCPPIAPNAGTSCAAGSPSCTYGVCDDTSGVRDQVIVECRDGAWVWTDTTCLS